MKFRLPILAKIAILGTATSVVAAGVSIWVSYRAQVSQSQQNMIENIDYTLDSLAYAYTEDENAEEANAGLLDVRSLAATYYFETREIKQEDYASFEEYEAVMRQHTVWFYPPAGAMIGSQAFINFRYNYRLLLSTVVNAQLSSGAISCFAAYFDQDTKSYVFMVDSRQQTRKQGSYYHVAASWYKLTDEDMEVTDQSGRYTTFLMGGFFTRTIDINYEGQVTASFFIQYNFDALNEANNQRLISLLITLSITFLAVIAVIILVSYVLFTRNIVKLTKAATQVTEKLSTSEPFDVVNPGIHSHDEMSTLNDSFLAMQHQLVNYIDIIKKEASEKEMANAELNVASKIQLESLPKTSFADASVALEASIKTAKEVGGDFYDYFYVGEKLAFSISDVSGKGVPAALFMMKSKELIKFKLSSGLPLEEAIKAANDDLVKNNTENLFVTSFIAMIDFENEEISYVNAGHEKPYILTSEGELIKLDGESNFVLGGVDGLDFIKESHPFHKGDRIFLFTDGLNESINDKEEEFGYERLEACLKELVGKPIKECLPYVMKAHDGFVGDLDPFDDITLMIVENQEKPFRLVYTKKDYSVITEATDAFEEAFEFLSPGVKAKVGIILDEILNNYISYEKREDLVIELYVHCKADELILHFSCNGADYDILKNHKKKYATTHVGLEEGGFGVAIVKDLAKDVSYRYENGHSYLTVVLDLNE